MANWQGRLVRYADDFVLLSPHRPDRALAWLQQLMTRLGLTLHPDKTRMLDVRHEDFVFLGHTHRWRFNRLYLNVSPKALRRIRDELRRKTRQTWLSLDAMIADLNPYIRGARHYFRRVRRRTLYQLDGFVNQRLARWWARKHGAAPAGMVARVPGCASVPARPGAVESPGGASSSRFKVCTVNVEGSRMRETRTYGLMRGCWLARVTHGAPGSTPPLLRIRLRAETCCGNEPCERRDRPSVRKTSCRGVTEAWVTGTHAEHRQTKPSERRFSAPSSGSWSSVFSPANRQSNKVAFWLRLDWNRRVCCDPERRGFQNTSELVE